jgi:hypothetical protein
LGASFNPRLTCFIFRFLNRPQKGSSGGLYEKALGDSQCDGARDGQPWNPAKEPTPPVAAEPQKKVPAESTKKSPASPKEPGAQKKAKRGLAAVRAASCG